MFNGKELGISAFSGAIFGLLTYIILLFIYPDDALILGLSSYLLFTIFLWIYLSIHNKRMNKRYSEIEKLIVSPVFHKVNGNFNLGKKVINGNIYFCETGIVFASFDEKPYRLQELSINQILKYEADNVRLNIYTKDNQVFVITIPNAEEIINVLREKDWIK